MNENPQMPEDTKLRMDDVKEYLKEYEIVRTRDEFFSRLITIIIAGLGLITVLAWDDILHDIFSIIFGKEGTLGEKILYAGLITLLATIASVYLSRLFLKKRKQK